MILGKNAGGYIKLRNDQRGKTTLSCVTVPCGKGSLHPGHLTEWAGSPGEKVWAVSEGFGRGTGTFTQLSETGGGRGRGNMSGARVSGGVS